MTVQLAAPPRKYSVQFANEPNYLGHKVRVFLDGVEQSRVIEYDCDAGYLVRYVVDPVSGQIMLTPDRREAKSETTKGAVTVDWRDE